MTRLARAFVAVVPPAEALDAVETRAASLRREMPSLRWLPRTQWHLTLAFLGPVDDAEALRAALTTAVRDRPPFPVRLGTGGAFPAPRRASVLFVGVASGEPGLTELAGRVRAVSTGLARHAEDRPFRAHLTVARAPRPRSLIGLVDTIGAGPLGPAWTVTDVAVIESDTRPDGAVHTVRDWVPLAGA